MDISENLREELVNEINFVISKIREEVDLRKKIFFYSGIYGLVNRIFNIRFDPQLVFMHLVLNTSFSLINDRINAIVLGKDTLVEIPDNFFDRLCNALEELARNIAEDEDTYTVLQRIATISYLTTGNGYYLYQKGDLEI